MLSKANEVEVMRNGAKSLLEDAKNDYENKKLELIREVEKLKRENISAQMNYESDLQNLRNVSKANSEKIDKKNYELSQENLKLKTELGYLNKQLRERENTANNYKDQLQRFSNQIEDQKSVYLTLDTQEIIRKMVNDEKDRLKYEIEDREKCLICADNKKNIVYLPCGHFAYCHPCFNSLGLQVNKKIPKNAHHIHCPLCEKPLEKAYIAFPY